MSYSWRDAVADFFVILVVGLLGFGMYFSINPTTRRILGSFTEIWKNPVKVGSPADYGWSVQTLDGREVPMSTFKGKVVFLNFWATWCGPCKHELPSIERLYQVFKNTDLAFLLVSDEDPLVLQRFAQSNKLQVPIYRVSRAPEFFHVRAIPITFILSRAGKVALCQSGARTWDKENIIHLLKTLQESNESQYVHD